MRILTTEKRLFFKEIESILRRRDRCPSSVEEIVKKILADVKQRGDRAVKMYTRKFDGIEIDAGSFRVKREDIKRAVAGLPAGDIRMLKVAVQRIRAFHRMQVQKSWSIRDRDGTLLGQRITPLDRIGIYVPGGKAAYPSTVLMNAIPAKIAGVKEINMVTPPDKMGLNPYLLAAADISGVDSIFTVGGAQAIAALAYGTNVIPRVDKITGPGNIYVATAKRLVFGIVDIDMIAGPSEILIINDGKGNPSWIAADLLSQAEHDELASSILLTTSTVMAEKVFLEVSRQIKGLKREAIARASIDNYGCLVVVSDLNEAVDIANRIAPEHLELFVEKPASLLKDIRNAGSIFLGSHTPEAMGDYMAGPNHILPTNGTARFSSPLGVYDFVKRSSIVSFSAKGIKRLAGDVERFTEVEGLEAHGRSVSIRLKK